MPRERPPTQSAHDPIMGSKRRKPPENLVEDTEIIRRFQRIGFSGFKSNR